MKTVVDLLSHLRASNVSLTLDGEALKISAPTGVLTAELRRELGARKPEIIAFLRASQGASRRTDADIPRVDRSRPLPLSFAQQRLWFLYQLDPESPVYNIGIPLRMKGALDVSALERAFQEIVRRHEDLRTRFIAVNGAPQAAIDDGSGWRVNVIPAEHLTDDGPGSELFRAAGEFSKQPFDITRGPLFRADLLRIAADNHVLVLTMHHMISDGWSMGVLVEEFRELYESCATGRAPKLAPLPIQYVDFAAWQRAWLEAGELDRQLPYWKKQLAGSPPVLVFPADHRRPQTEMFRGRRSKLVLEKPLVAALEQLGQAHGVTLFMTTLAAFKVLLARYSGQDDIVLGSPSANRSRAELNPLIGFFVNNLVLRTDLGGNPTFAELLGRVREVTMRAYEHQDVPFDKLVQALKPERSLDHSPLFQVMFSLQNFPLEDLHLAGVITTPLELDVETARFDMTVEVFPRQGELWAYFDYNSDLYEPETIAQIERHFVMLLNAVCADPNLMIGEIPLLAADERRKLLIDWNRTQAPIPEGCFHQRIAQQALASPDRLAVIAGEASLTYGELERRASDIAAPLQKAGAGPGRLVALCVGRSTDLIAGMLGIAKTGAAYIPLDPAYPTQRIENIFEDAKPQAVLTTKALRNILPAGAVPVVILDAIPQAGSLAPVPVSGEDLAYVIFTSGSTGRPKGVEIPHGALMNFLTAMEREPGFTAKDVLLAVTTPSFDIAGLELLLPLYTGATVAIALDPGNPVALLDEIERYRPTVLQATPATWKLLIAAGWKGDAGLKILCGGEALDTDLARSLVVRSGSVWNMYGPTETTIWSAALHVESVDGSAIPVGRPIQNTTFYILDRLGNPVPQGVAGELWIGGAGLARGYLNRPDLTAERFIVSPFSEPPSGERLYRTGDLVRYRPDGTLDFFGRMDHQVKFRGFRIELGEIENALRGCPGIADAVVLLREDNGEKRLVGYLVSMSAEPPVAAELKEHLRASLPEYMVPGAFLFLAEFPRLPNGKLDRSALPAPERAKQQVSAVQDEKANGLEQAVAGVFRDVLGMERVALDDNFFDLGAHSLEIVKVHSELNQKIGGKVPLIGFFQYPTIRSLARYIEQGQPGRSSAMEESLQGKSL